MAEDIGEAGRGREGPEGGRAGDGRRPVVVSARNIRYSYGTVEALKGVDLNLFAEEIHVLTGDHRSGKSTLGGIISGRLRRQVGSISVRGLEPERLEPADALALGIGMVYQFPEIAPSLTALENLYLGRMPHFYIASRDARRMRESCLGLFEELGIGLDPDLRGSALTGGQKVMLELARVVSSGASILILDEISSRLTPRELDELYRTLDASRRAGRSVLYITSNMDEAFRIADRVTVLRDGLRQGTENIQSIDRSRLVNLAYSFALNRAWNPEERRQILFINRYDEAIIRDLPTGIVLLDPRDEVIVMNPAAERILGRSKRAFTDIIEEGGSGGGAEGTAEAARPGRGALFFLEGVEGRREIEEAIRSKVPAVWERLALGPERFLKIKVFPLSDEEGGFMGTTVFVEDVSIDYVTKEYLLRAEKVASTAELAAGVAHEINNPLGIIQNYLELLKLREGMSEEERLSLDRIQGEMNRIVDIISSLLSFSRSRQSPARPIDLKALLDELLILVSHKLSAKSIEVERDYVDGDVAIEGFDNKLKQLFLNLISNAIEAVLDHGRIAVRVGRDERRRYALVSIVDNGYGIPPEIRDDIFTPFFSTKMTKTNTGLGLSICQHIVELHGGLISFESDPGKETRFEVRLPLR
jgi:two-component system, NtrC family, sensor histidine kinase AtoS